MRLILLIILHGVLFTSTLTAQIWEGVEPTGKTITRSDETSFRQALSQYRLIDFPDNPRDGDFITIPGPAGQLIAVEIRNSPVLEEALQIRFPQIRSFSFRSNQITGRLASDPGGIDIVINIGNHRYSIEQADGNIYNMYRLTGFGRDLTDGSNELGECLTPMSLNTPPAHIPDINLRRSSVVNQKIYDLAISVTSTYSARHGGSTESVLAQINKIFNRVNEVFLREVALRFQIIDESTQLFFHEKENDPYTEGNNTLMLNTLDEQLVKTIGRSNFDLGHLLATNCGRGTAGVSAGVGTICEFSKGKALSCDLTNDLEDYVRVLTHELGHQLGAAHTWSNCPGINNTQRAGNSAYEPGSGSSIMSYINTCGNQNLRYIPGPFYFHTGSIQQMVRYMEIGPGSACVTTEELANENPEITSINIPEDQDLYIPVGTPFVLSATATDNDNDVLTYSWDQLNIGPIAPLGEPIQSGPSIRSFAPDTTGTRYIPRLDALLHSGPDQEEVLPTYDRDMTFGLTVRDNHENGGGIVQKTVSFKSTTTAGPFFIDFPNDTTDRLYAGSLARVQWNVAGTDKGLVNAPHVMIRMSVDGGKTFPVILSEKTENDGEEDIQIPDIASDSVRFMIQGYDHVFFDISDQNIPIVLPDEPTFGLHISPGRQIICLPENASVSVTSFPVLGFDETLHYSIENPYSDVAVMLTDTLSEISGTVNITFDVPVTLDSDTLHFKLNAFGDSKDTISRDISLIVVNNSHSQLTLQYPDDDVQGIEVVPTFQWNPSPNADYYNLEVSTSASFHPDFIVLSEPNITSDSISSTVILEEGEIYFWRVLPQNLCTTTTNVPVAGFQTKIQDCRTYPGPGLPTGLGASAPGEIVSAITVEDDFEISDVNVLDVGGFHESVNQLKLTLQKDTFHATLYEGECGIRSLNIDISFDDESVDYTDCRLSAGTRVKPLEPLSVFQGSTSRGTWNIHWQDSVIGAGGIFQAATLELCGALNLDPLEVSTDTLYVAPGGQNPLTIDQVAITDANGVIYEWVDTTSHGQLLKNGVPLRPGQKWSHDDILSGIIQYKNNSDFETEAIIISAESPDGRWSGLIEVPVRLDELVSVGPNTATGKIKVFPNPASQYITIQSRPELAIQRIRILDIQGKELYRHVSGSDTHDITVSTSSWSPGPVFISITTDNDVWTEKIIILP